MRFARKQDTWIWINVPDEMCIRDRKDRDDIRFGVEQGVDFIAASFVRNAECILEIKALLRELKAPYIPIIAKIENAEGIQNIDEIIRCADGIMICLLYTSTWFGRQANGCVHTMFGASLCISSSISPVRNHPSPV